MRDIKHYNAQHRQYIAHLATYAYQCYRQKAEIHLNLNVAQAKKYGRYQFSFDPDKGYDHYHKFLQAAFNYDEQGTRQIFYALQAEYPQGIEIWVNDTPDKISSSPITENSTLLMLDSLFSSSTRLLYAEGELQAEYIKKYYVTEKRQESQARMELKYKHIYANIRREHEKLKIEVNKLYQALDLDPKIANAQMKQWVINFHRFVVSQVTVFSLEDEAAPSKKDYQRIYKQIGILEQRQKLEYFLKEQKPLPEEKQFNRDLFALDIEEVDENSIIQKARMHYMDRHYTLTTEQRLLKQQDENFSSEEVKPYRPQVTATAHSPDYLLPNYARVEEGAYNNIPDVNPVSITLMTSRYGSPSPNEQYQQTLKPYDDHEAIYRTLLTMNQQLQAMRQQVIQTELSKYITDPAFLRHYARLLAVEITHTLHQINMGLSVEKDPEEAVKKHLATIKAIPNDCLTPTILNTLLGSSLKTIINIKNTHMHLITSTGLGSQHDNQRDHFLDASIAQYATQLPTPSNLQPSSQAGYSYMSMGVDFIRGETFTFSRGWHGNNDTNLISIYLDLKSKYPVPELDMVDGNFLLYGELLQVTRIIAKEYLSYIETHYIKPKLESDQLQLAIKQDQALEQRLRKLGRLIDSKQLNALRHNIDKKQQKLSTLSSELKKHKTALNSLKSRFRNAEATLHQEAKYWSLAIYKKIQAVEKNRACIDNLINTHEPSVFLAWKSYQQAMVLFHETERVKGTHIPKWKLGKNNGLFQTFIQIAIEQAGFFASGGCKSANDREILVALNMAEAANVMEHTEEGQSLFNEQQQFIKDAQKRYHYHVGQRQTALDRSGLPKLGHEILQHVDKDTVSLHKNIADLASHRRATKGEHLKNSQVKTLQSMSVSGQMNDQWKNHTLFSYKDPVAKKLTYLLFERGLTTQEKLKAYQALLPQKMKICQQQEVEKRLLVLQAEIRVEQKKIDALNKTPEYLALKKILDGLQATLERHKNGEGKGIETLRQLMKKYPLSQTDESMDNLIELIEEIKEIALARRNDWTQFFAKSCWNIGDSKTRRPLWLIKLYEHYAKLSITNTELLRNNPVNSMK